MIDLKPCPFCGGTAQLFVQNGVRVKCTKCGAQTMTRCDPPLFESGHRAVESVINDWNRRVPEKSRKEVKSDEQGR